MKRLYPRKPMSYVGLLSRPCAICKQRKPSTQFHLLSKATGYRHSYCKPCQALYMKQRYKVLKAYKETNY